MWLAEAEVEAEVEAVELIGVDRLGVMLHRDRVFSLKFWSRMVAQRKAAQIK